MGLGAVRAMPNRGTGREPIPETLRVWEGQPSKSQADEIATAFFPSNAHLSGGEAVRSK